QGRGTKKEKPATPGGDGDKKDSADAQAEKDKPPAQEPPPAPAPTIRNARRLTSSTDVEHGPVWSPDGQYVAYVTWNDDDGGRIYRVRADGSGQPERLTPVAAL